MRSFIIGLIFIGCVASFGDAAGAGGLLSETGEYIPESVITYYTNVLDKVAPQLVDVPVELMDKFPVLLKDSDDALREGNLNKLGDILQELKDLWTKVLPFAKSGFKPTIFSTIDALGATQQKLTAGTATLQDIDAMSTNLATGFGPFLAATINAVDNVIADVLRI